MSELLSTVQQQSKGKKTFPRSKFILFRYTLWSKHRKQMGLLRLVCCQILVNIKYNFEILLHSVNKPQLIIKTYFLSEMREWTCFARKPLLEIHHPLYSVSAVGSFIGTYPLERANGGDIVDVLLVFGREFINITLSWPDGSYYLWDKRKRGNISLWGSWHVLSVTAQGIND